VLEGLLVPWSLSHFGWRRTFLIVGFTGLLWLVPWLRVAPRALRATSPPHGHNQPRNNTAFRFSALVTNRNLWGICLGFFCFDYYWYLLVTWLPDYLVTVRHLTIFKAGIFASMPFFVFGISEPLGGWVADRLVHMGWSETRARKSVVTVAFATGLLLIPAARVETASAAIAFIIGGSLVGLATGNLLVILQLCAPPGQVGLWTGVENFIGNIAGILAPLVTGFLISRTGSYSPGFALAAIILVAGLLAYWLIVGELRQSPQNAQ
jgi:nitrate/nitrite transporter NarK